MRNIAITSATFLIAAAGCHCNCATSEEEFLWAFGVQENEVKNVSVSDLTKSANQHLVGKPASSFKLSETLKPESCAERNATKIDCKYSFSQNNDLFRVVVTIDAKSTIAGVNITRESN